MTLLTTSGVVFLAALLCAAGMGLAIQRGGTCAVAAVEEVLAERRLTRLLAIVEASLWVSAGLLLAHRFGLLNALPAIRAALMAPMEVPITQSGSMPRSCSAW